MPAILVVDDEEIILQSFIRILEKEDLTLFTAQDKKGALEKLENPISLFICDVRMPDVDGLELIKNAKEKNPLLKTILLTGFEDATIREAAEKLHVDLLLTKPIRDIGGFVQAIHRLLNS